MSYRVFIFIACIMYAQSHACSTYKVTLGDKTMFGFNYDNWTTNPKIWFETNKYGSVFTGANYFDGMLSPASGMNEYGLCFGTLATATPDKEKSYEGKLKIESRAQFLKQILHSCKTVDEVKVMLEKYDRTMFAKDVFFYVDKNGNYLIVEPFEMIMASENKYVLGNFCPSTITDYNTIKQERYINGSLFLKNKIDTSLQFCTSLSDTMHVCREKIGDGTLLTSILDLKSGIINLYFYHDYNNVVQFNLKEELAKGDHMMEIPSLFPTNKEYQKLLTYQTPQNNRLIASTLFIFILLFGFSFVYFITSYFRNKNKIARNYQLALTVLSLCFMYYMYVLVKEINIFYFPAPYKHYTFGLIDIVSYLPYVLILFIIPSIVTNVKMIKNKTWSFFPTLLFITNNIAYLVLIGLFYYWGFYWL